MHITRVLIMRKFGIALGLSTSILACPLSLAVSAPLSPTLADVPPNSVKTRQVFDIFRGDDKIGTNTVDIERQNDTTQVKIATDIHVKVMFIEAYRYAHSCKETWKNGQLVAFKSETDDNGTKHAINVVAPSPDKVNIEIDGKHSDALKGMFPASLWSKDIINQQDIFDPVTGKRLSIKVKDLGEETLQVQSATHKTHHYKITDKTGDYERDVWFDGDVLVRMKLLGSDHSTITSDLR
ncbi:MAG TPA: DUF6134 family protein [Beijerinckia sp.]|jgi:hypothetical protein|nr:DUF6134 family protein [Beijerinckia sp.]